MISPLATAAPKPGTICTKLGATATSAGIKYTCIKSGKKLVWNKGVSIKVPAPLPSVSPTPSASPSPSAVGNKSESVDELNGKTCTNENQIITNSAGEFWCLKTNDGLRWAKNNPNPNPKQPEPAVPTPSPTKTISPDEIGGQICVNENERIRNSIDEFYCLKASDGVLRWSENFRFRDPNPRPILPPISYVVNKYVEPKMPSAPIQNCMIQENSNEGSKNGDGLSSGFPFNSRYRSYPKIIKMALVPIDFADLEGDKNFRSRVNDQMQTMSDWYRDVSGGRLTIQWVVSENWIRLPGSSKDYYVQYSGKYPDTENFWKKVIPVVDSKFDLTGVQTINFLFPVNQHVAYESVQSFSYVSEMKLYNSSKTQLISFAAGGEVFEAPDTNLWSYWSHEFGHQIGLAHIGSSRGDVEPMNGLDLLGNQNGPYRELSGWMRFIIGWLSDTQIYCQSTAGFSSNEISLVPLSDSNDGIKTVVIPTGVESAIVIDSRRPTKYSCDIPNLPGGVLVYTYDAKLGNQSYFLKAQYPVGRKPAIRCQTGATFPDVLLHAGDSVQVGDYKITVLSSGTFDQIRISKN